MSFELSGWLRKSIEFSQTKLSSVDFNVPIKDGKVASTQRIVAAIESIKYALDKGAKSVVSIKKLCNPDFKASVLYK